MTSSIVCFIKPPHRPEHISAEIWESEWVGMCVEVASVFLPTVGSLWDLSESRTFYDSQAGLHRTPTQRDAIEFISMMRDESAWVSRAALIHSCENSDPPRMTILAWLAEEPQKSREIFVVPQSVAMYSMPPYLP